MEITARLYDCALCDQQVVICSDCDHGNVYCPPCAPIARKQATRSYNQQYQQTKKGKANNAARQKRFREKQHKKDGKPLIEAKKITDHPSQPEISSVSSESTATKEVDKSEKIDKKDKTEQLCCTFCGKEVSFKRDVNLSDKNIAKIIRGELLPQGP